MNFEKTNIIGTRDAVYNKRGIYKRLLAICMILSILLSSAVEPRSVKAADAVPGTSVGVTVDYTQEIATVTPGAGGSTRFYMSTDGKKNWEMIDDSRVVDLSSILSTKEVIVYFKGNKDTYELPYTLQAESAKELTVSYKITSGVGKIDFSATTPVEYKKGANGAWRQVTSPIFTSIYEIKGATLYFRTAATVAKRAGKTISVKIGKKPSAPSAKVDGSKLILSGLKLGETVYRINDGPITSTSKADKVNYLDLKALGVSASGAILGGTIELYNVGTDKKLRSSVRVINVPAQADAPLAVTVTGTSISITDTNPKTLYEYTVVNKSATFDPMKAKWSQITSKKPVIVKNASLGDKIYVRLKSTTDPITKQIILASAYRIEEVKSITYSK